MTLLNLRLLLQALVQRSVGDLVGRLAGQHERRRFFQLLDLAVGRGHLLAELEMLQRHGRQPEFAEVKRADRLQQPGIIIRAQQPLEERRVKQP